MPAGGRRRNKRSNMTYLLEAILTAGLIWLLRGLGTRSQIITAVIAFPVLVAALFLGLIGLAQ